MRTRRSLGIAAIVLILGQAIWRTAISLRGYFLQDDYIFASLASTKPLDWSYLTRVHNGHLMPGGSAIAWFLDKVAPFSWTAMVISITILQLAASFAVWAMLRTLFGNRPAVLPLLTLYLISPLTLYAWWAVAVAYLPIQMAFALMVTCHVRWVRTGSARWLWSAVGSLVLGLIFGETALLILPFLVVLTAWFVSEGGSGIRYTLRAHTRAWATYFVIAVGYLALYTSVSNEQFDITPPVAGLAQLTRNMVGATFVPSMFGGPWRWATTELSPVMFASPPSIAKWATWGIAFTVIAISIVIRRRAARSWTVLAAYLAIQIGLVWGGRLEVFGPGLGLGTRFVTNNALVAVAVLGIALLPLVGEHDAYSPRGQEFTRWLSRRTNLMVTVTAIATSALILSAAISTHRYGQLVAANEGKSWTQTALRSLAAADRNHLLLDDVAPTTIADPLYGPYALTSFIFAPVHDRPPFGRYTDYLQQFDESGNLQPAVVAGVATLPGPIVGCGYRATPAIGARLPLDHDAYSWVWTIRLTYSASSSTSATVGLGPDYADVELQAGHHNLFVPLTGGGDAVTVDSIASGSVCIEQAEVGLVYPANGS